MHWRHPLSCSSEASGAVMRNFLGLIEGQAGCRMWIKRLAMNSLVFEP